MIKPNIASIRPLYVAMYFKSVNNLFFNNQSANVTIGFFQINIEPLYLSVTSSHVIVASRDAFYIWHFRTAQSWTTLRLDSSNKTANSQNTNTKSSERLYHVDDTPGGMYLIYV